MTDPWDQLARSRDQKSGDRGDLWHRALIDPSVRRLVGPVRGLRVLEVACGNGYLSRRFAASGAAEVVGIDRSFRSIRRARARERACPRGVRFEVGDAEHLTFARGSFDLVVANMAFMDIRNARRAIREAARVLAPAGRLVFSINHPCFDVDLESSWEVEAGFDAEAGGFRQSVFRKVRGYRNERKVRVPWKLGPRTLVWTESYHRTLATYCRYLYEAGLAISRLEEPLPGPEMLSASPQGPFLQEIPLHLVVEAVRSRELRPGWRTTERSRPAVARRSGSGDRSAGSGSLRRGSKTGS